MDAWRAHLNVLTWPEVARQVAVCAGLGRRRYKPRKEQRPKMGQEGEDVVADETGGWPGVACFWGLQRQLERLSSWCRLLAHKAGAQAQAGVLAG